MSLPQASPPARPPAVGASSAAGPRPSDETRSAVVLAMAVAAGLLGLVVVLVLFPDLLAWLVALGILAFVVVAAMAILLSVGLAMLTFGVGAFYLFKPREEQGPETSYTLDMVRDPKEERR
jgi:hypothetical protein